MSPGVVIILKFFERTTVFLRIRHLLSVSGEDVFIHIVHINDF